MPESPAPGPQREDRKGPGEKAQNMKRLLVTGASGFLGHNLCRLKRLEWDIFGTVNKHPVKADGVNLLTIDLTNRRELVRAFREIKPHGVIHAAAASNLDWCQLNSRESYKINVEASAGIASLCAELSIPCVYTSTDMVFDGLNAPYREEDSVSPVNVYGEQKALAEELIIREYPLAAVCRLSLMFGNPGPAASNFTQTMVDAMRDGRELHLFTDEFRTPVSVWSAVEGLFMALHEVHGIMHLGGRERISRYEFGCLVKRLADFADAKLIPCLQKDVKTAAPRPPDASLDSSRAFGLGFRPGTLEEEVKTLLASPS